MKKIIINMLCCLIIVTCSYIYLTTDSININLDNSEMYYLKSVSYGTVNRIDSDNIIKCDLTAVSNSINKLLYDGFIIEKETYNKDFMDLILSKNNEVYRIYYTNDGIFTSIASPYKNSAIPITYINEKKK